MSTGHVLPEPGMRRFDRLPRARAPGPACLHGPYGHCACCCRWCFEDSQSSLTDYVVIPHVSWEHMQRYVPTVIQWAQLCYAMRDHLYAFDHQRQVPL